MQVGFLLTWRALFNHYKEGRVIALLVPPLFYLCVLAYLEISPCLDLSCFCAFCTFSLGFWAFELGFELIPRTDLNASYSSFLYLGRLGKAKLTFSHFISCSHFKLASSPYSLSQVFPQRRVASFAALSIVILLVSYLGGSPRLYMVIYGLHSGPHSPSR